MRICQKYIFSLLTILALVACQKNESSDNGETYAATPAQNCADAANPACIPAQPNYYQQNAPQFINYQWGYANGFCGCPVGFRPVFNSNWGLACAPLQWQGAYTYNSVISISVQNIFYGPQNGQWTSVPQMTYSPATYGSASQCGAQASLVCDIRVPTSCSGGSQCIAAGGGTYMGFCTRGSGNEYFRPQFSSGANCYVFNGNVYVNVCSGSGYNSGGLLPR